MRSSVIQRNRGSLSAIETQLCELVRRVAAGEESALEALYRELEEPVHGFAARLLQDPGAAEEATVEVFTRVWERAATYDPERGHVIAWVLTMARSACIERLRSKRRESSAQRSLDEARELAAELSGPPSHAEVGETAARIQGALRALPREQADLLRAAFFGGLSYRQVAETFGQPLGTVKTRIRAGLAALRRSLAPEGERA